MSNVVQESALMVLDHTSAHVQTAQLDNIVIEVS